MYIKEAQRPHALEQVNSSLYTSTTAHLKPTPRTTGYEPGLQTSNPSTLCMLLNYRSSSRIPTRRSNLKALTESNSCTQIEVKFLLRKVKSSL